MEKISYEEWIKRFFCRVDLDVNDTAVCTFYDNGAVKDESGDFIVKCDQVKERTM